MNATNLDTCRFWRSVFAIQQAYRAGTTTEQESTIALRPHFTACNDEEIKTFLDNEPQGEKKL